MNRFLNWYRHTQLSRHSAIVWRVIAILMIIAGLSSGVYYLCDLHKEYGVFIKGDIDVAKTGAVGDFIAGTIGTVFSLAGFIIVYLTYKDQIQANEKDKIEQRFFILLQIHVDNSDNISYQNPYNANNSN
jgi:hypothetical protein